MAIVAVWCCCCAAAVLLTSGGGALWLQPLWQVEAHVHMAPELFDSYSLEAFPQPKFCDWLGAEGVHLLTPYMGSRTMNRVFSTLCSSSLLPSSITASAARCVRCAGGRVVNELNGYAAARRLAAASSLTTANGVSQLPAIGHKEGAPPKVPARPLLPAAVGSPVPADDERRHGRKRRRSAAASKGRDFKGSRPPSSGIQSGGGDGEPDPTSRRGAGKAGEARAARGDARSDSSCFSPFCSFGSAVLSAISITVASELGDRTFFLAALLAAKCNKWLVFLATCAALFFVTAFSTFLGALIHFLPDASFVRGRLGPLPPLDAWLSAALFLFFAVNHLRAFYRAHTVASKVSAAAATAAPSSPPRSLTRAVVVAAAASAAAACKRPADASDTPAVEISPQKGTEARALVNASREAATGNLTRDSFGHSETAAAARKNSDTRGSNGDTTCPGDSPQGCTVALEEEAALALQAVGRRTSLPEDVDGVDENLAEAEEEMERLQYTRLGLRPSSLKVLWEVFLVISAAEIGDKSMFATVTLATSQNPFGVFVGSCAGHAAVTALAVVAGTMLRGRLNERLMNLGCGVLFLALGLFAVADACTR